LPFNYVFPRNCKEICVSEQFLNGNRPGFCGGLLKKIRNLKVICIRFCFSLVILPVLISAANAESGDELRILQLFYKDSDLVVTPSRYPKPISSVAENMTIITSEDIKSINAHTLSDVLVHVTGVQTAILGTPGSLANVQIQGSETRQVLVTIDGVVQNNLSDGVADFGAIPVQNIERIEIVKGPASSSWGSSLGGIINIITKSPDDSREFGGKVSASIGNRSTGDYRTEFSGKAGGLGYYLEGGGLCSDGLLPHNSVHSGNLYSKFTLNPSDKSTLLLTTGYTNGTRGVAQFQDTGTSFNNDFEYLYSSLAVHHSFTDELSADASLRFMHRDIRLSQNIPATGDQVDVTGREFSYGGALKLAWDHGFSQLVAGTEFDLGRLDAGNVATSAGQSLTKFVAEDLNRYAFFVNDTLAFRKFSFIPGIRYDYTSTNGDFVSPSLGITCILTKDTVLRGYVARGFNIPPLGTTSGSGFFSIPNPNLKMEKVLSYSAGFETAELKYVWLKATFFRHDIDDVLTDEIVSNEPPRFTTINGGKQRRQGVEVEARSMPLFNTSLVAGYTFIDAENRETGQTIPDIPKYTVDVGLQYENKKYFSGNLKGHYIWWNSTPTEKGKYTAMIWDLNIAKTLFARDKRAVEVFFTAHNVFNGSQYPLDIYKNPRRWFEGGLRFEF
jgi:vitamin B12 transporter